MDRNETVFMFSLRSSLRHRPALTEIEEILFTNPRLFDSVVKVQRTEATCQPSMLETFEDLEVRDPHAGDDLGGQKCPVAHGGLFP